MFAFQPQKTEKIQTRLAGVSYENRQEVIKQLQEDTELYLVREPHNKYDPYAVAVYALLPTGKKQIGYLPKEHAQNIAYKLDIGESAVVQFLRFKKEDHGYMDYEAKKENRWEFIGVVVGIMI